MMEKSEIESESSGRVWMVKLVALEPISDPMAELDLK